MKTHTQYPYQITTVEQLEYCVENNLIVNLADERGKVEEFDSGYFFNNDKTDIWIYQISRKEEDNGWMDDQPHIVPKTIDELEVEDVVRIDGEDYMCEVNNTEWFQKLLTSKATTFPHPLPIDLFPILDNK